MKLSSSITLIILLSVLSGCLTGPNSDRDNPFDVGSDHYIPYFSNLTMKASTTSRRVRVSWDNNTVYGDGFIVERKIGEQTSFTPLDTVVETSFLDTSLEFALDMTYRITSFKELESGELTSKYSLETEDVPDFGAVTDYITYVVDDSLFVRWRNNSLYSDLMMLEYQEGSSVDWETIYTLEEPISKLFIVGVPLASSSQTTQNFRITLYLKDYQGNQVAFSSVSINHQPKFKWLLRAIYTQCLVQKKGSKKLGD